MADPKDILCDLKSKDYVSLKEFIMHKIEALEEKIELNLRLNQVALDKADDKMNERLARMNEFRDALKDQASKFITRDSVEEIQKQFEVRLRSLELKAEAMDTRMYSLANVSAEVATSTEKRFESVNEFRGQLRDQASTFMTRDIYDARHSEMQRQIDELRLSRATLEGKASSMSVYIAYALAVISMFINILAHHFFQ